MDSRITNHPCRLSPNVRHVPRLFSVQRQPILVNGIYVTSQKQDNDLLPVTATLKELSITLGSLPSSATAMGLYGKARQGLIPEFIGISDPYEVPAVQEIYLYLLREGYLEG